MKSVEHAPWKCFWFLKNDNLDANSWSNDQNDIARRLHNSSVWRTLGGPILKDKLFFFMDYEALRYHTAGGTSSSVAPAAFRTGDSSLC